MLVVHNGEEQERLMRCAMVVDREIPVPASVSPEVSEHLQVLLKHCLRPPSVFIGQLETL